MRASLSLLSEQDAFLGLLARFLCIRGLPWNICVHSDLEPNRPLVGESKLSRESKMSRVATRFPTQRYTACFQPLTYKINAQLKIYFYSTLIVGSPHAGLRPLVGESDCRAKAICR